MCRILLAVFMMSAVALLTTAFRPETATPQIQATPEIVGGATLPQTGAFALLETSCQQCHSISMVLQQRLSKATWTAEIAKMRGFGSPLAKNQQAALAGYLARYLGPDVRRTGARMQVTAPPITFSQAPAGT